MREIRVVVTDLNTGESWERDIELNDFDRPEPWRCDVCLKTKAELAEKARASRGASTLRLVPRVASPE